MNTLCGLLTLEERKSKSISVWHKTKEQIAKLVPPTMHKANPVFMIFDSGSRGNDSQLTQMAGMKGVVINPLEKPSNCQLSHRLKKVLMFWNILFLRTVLEKVQPTLL